MAESKQRHYSDEEWADFVRQLISGPESQRMLEHLDSGCLSCLDAVGTWSALARLGRTEPSQELAAALTARAVCTFGADSKKASSVRREKATSLKPETER